MRPVRSQTQLEVARGLARHLELGVEARQDRRQGGEIQVFELETEAALANPVQLRPARDPSRLLGVVARDPAGLEADCPRIARSVPGDVRVQLAQGENREGPIRALFENRQMTLDDVEAPGGKTLVQEPGDDGLERLTTHFVGGRDFLLRLFRGPEGRLQAPVRRPQDTQPGVTQQQSACLELPRGQTHQIQLQARLGHDQGRPHRARTRPHVPGLDGRWPVGRKVSRSDRDPGAQRAGQRFLEELIEALRSRCPQEPARATGSQGHEGQAGQEQDRSAAHGPSIVTTVARLQEPVSEAVLPPTGRALIRRGARTCQSPRVRARALERCIPSGRKALAGGGTDEV
jgi:hypothetical protein